MKTLLAALLILVGSQSFADAAPNRAGSSIMRANYRRVVRDARTEARNHMFDVATKTLARAKAIRAEYKVTFGRDIGLWGNSVGPSFREWRAARAMTRELHKGPPNLWRSYGDNLDGE